MTFLLEPGSKIGIIACSNGINPDISHKIEKLENILSSININVVYAKTLYSKYSIFNGTGKERGNELNELFRNKDVKAIFDISGGDLANEVLDYIDYDLIKNNPKPFFGYSDLSVILNAIYSKTSVPTYNYQLSNLIKDNGREQLSNFKSTFLNEKSDLFDFDYKWIQGNSMEGIVVGGNIRCFLKLAGTKYMPDFKDKILLLESLGGDVAKMTTYLTQYKQLGVFQNITGILLGTFTEMESKQYTPDIIELLTGIVDNPNIPIAKTNSLGHGADSKCISIGGFIRLS